MQQESEGWQDVVHMHTLAAIPTWPHQGCGPRAVAESRSANTNFKCKKGRDPPTTARLLCCHPVRSYSTHDLDRAVPSWRFVPASAAVVGDCCTRAAVGASATAAAAAAVAAAAAATAAVGAAAGAVAAAVAAAEAVAARPSMPEFWRPWLPAHTDCRLLERASCGPAATRAFTSSSLSSARYDYPTILPRTRSHHCCPPSTHSGWRATHRVVNARVAQLQVQHLRPGHATGWVYRTSFVGGHNHRKDNRW